MVSKDDMVSLTHMWLCPNCYQLYEAGIITGRVDRWSNGCTCDWCGHEWKLEIDGDLRTGPQGDTCMPKWEYRVLHSVSFTSFPVTSVPLDEPGWEVLCWNSVAEWLEKEANDGWELVHLSDVKQNSYHAIVRRQVIEGRGGCV